MLAILSAVLCPILCRPAFMDGFMVAEHSLLRDGLVGYLIELRWWEQITPAHRYYSRLHLSRRCRANGMVKEHCDLAYSVW